MNPIDKARQWLYYLLIGLISLVCLVFLPMVGSTTGLEWNIPNTTVGWIVWGTTKAIVATVNVMIFYCFMEQAKLNVAKNDNYRQAKDILIEVKIKEVMPRSPHKWNSQQYLQKGTSIFLTSGLSCVALSQALLSYDYMTLLSYLFTIIMGVVFGVLQMKNAEEYWTDEYLKYALNIKKERQHDSNT